MRTLRPDELLAIEPGNLRLEAARHLQFQHLRVAEAAGREWFQRGDPELTQHIANMMLLHPLPSLADLLPKRPPPAVPLPEPTVPLSELAAALEWVRSQEGRAAHDLTNAELIEGIRVVELLMVGGREWSARMIATLRFQGVSWSQLVESTGIPQTTLWNRTRKLLQVQ